jgi:hypothetical protein
VFYVQVWMHWDPATGDGGICGKKIATLQAHTTSTISALACNAATMLTACTKGFLKVGRPSHGWFALTCTGSAADLLCSVYPTVHTYDVLVYALRCFWTALLQWMTPEPNHVQHTHEARASLDTNEIANVAPSGLKFPEHIPAGPKLSDRTKGCQGARSC